MIWVMPIVIVTITTLALSYGYLRSDNSDLPLKVGFQELVFEDTSRSFDETPRKLEVAIWYPTDQTDRQESINRGFWKIQNVIRDAPITGERLPLIIFSHGYGGSQWSNSWFAEQLVPHGYIVAIVRHYGNSAKNMIPELSVRAWNRPTDVSFVLDQLLQDPYWGQHIDQNKIGAAGFSQGGMTSLWLAGIQAQLTPEILHRQITALSDPEWRNEHFADLPTERLDTILDQFTTHDFDAANKSYQDPRIKAVFAMAPALDAENIMFTPEGLSKVHIPVHIIVGQADTECMPQAEFFAQHIPNSSLTIIPGPIGHLTFLNEGIEAGNTIYTTDHPSINRKQIHSTVAAQALQFFDQHIRQE